MKAISASSTTGNLEKNPAPESETRLRTRRMTLEEESSSAGECASFARSIRKITRPMIVAVLDARHDVDAIDQGPRLDHVLSELARIRDYASIIIARGRTAMRELQSQSQRIVELEAALADARTKPGAR